MFQGISLLTLDERCKCHLKVQLETMRHGQAFEIQKLKEVIREKYGRFDAYLQLKEKKQVQKKIQIRDSNM